MNIPLLKSTLISVLRDAGYQAPASLKDGTPQSYRHILGDVLIGCNVNWKDQTLQLIDQIWKEEGDGRTTVPVQNLPSITNVHGTNITLWQGDITQLQGENVAIVNAANDQGLGCFVPEHRCIDNVIHRQAGPRLRLECQRLMDQRDRPLAAGTEPIVTSGYFLPSGYVIHVTGPQVRRGSALTSSDKRNLQKAYELVLDTAAMTGGIQSVSFPCISTGVFGFPQDAAAKIASTTVKNWLERNQGVLDCVVFNVFTDTDLALYQEKLPKVFGTNGTQEIITDVQQMEVEAPVRTRAVDLAKQWIDDADAVLICAGAGMSVKEGEMVYTNPKDFAKAYPWFPKWGYKTSYECMGLMGDPSVPQTAKWALNAKHMDNMRWSYTPNEGYDQLLDLVKDKDYFVLTSNVDGCFERSGFDANKIYTPQGEWAWVQCMNGCQPDSVFESRPYIDKILPVISEDGFIPQELIPKCPRCGSGMFGNVRGGGWFLHHKYEKQAQAIHTWMQNKADDNSRVVVIEIGAGFNTPTVTRMPVESFARELGDNARFIRVNPTEAEVPEDLKAIAFEEGWHVLGEFARSDGIGNKAVVAEEEKVKHDLLHSNLLVPKQMMMRYKRYFGHFDWRRFLGQLAED